MSTPARPFISIILPVYNRQHKIAKAIQSVLDQTYEYFELIIVNDASTDQTESVIRSFYDDRIRYFTHDRTKGASAARNTGINLAKGEWIAFHDSDDEWMPEKLEKQVEIVNRFGSIKPSPVIYTGFYRYNRDGIREYIPSKSITKKEGIIVNSLLNGNFVSTQTVILKKECILKVGGFDENLPRFQDWELWLRLAPEHPFILIDEPLVNVYFSEKSISADSSLIVEAYRIIYEKHQKLLAKVNPLDASSFLASYGHNLCLSGNLNEGRTILKNSLKLNPLFLRSAMCYAASLLGADMYKKIYQTLKRYNFL